MSGFRIWGSEVPLKGFKVSGLVGISDCLGVGVR